MGARALVLGGGGVRGIFQAGAIQRLCERGETEWRVFTGVSAGAVNALMAAQGKSEEMDALWMRQIETGLGAFRPWIEVANSALKEMSAGLRTHADVEGLDGLYDNNEMRELVTPFAAGLSERLDRLGHHLRIGLLCLQTGEYLAVDPVSQVSPGVVTDLVVAATATPLAFAPVELELDVPGVRCSRRRCQFVAAGARNITPLRDAITAAREANIELDGIDVIDGTPETGEGADYELHGLLEIGLLVEDILANRVLQTDVECCSRANAMTALRDRLEGLVDAGDEAALTALEWLKVTVPAILRYRRLELRVIRPTTSSWRAFTGRTDADLSLEFPGDLTRNAELLRLCHRYGRWLAEHAEHHMVVSCD
ncbi:MAG: patatin-like phospholipase family protein [Acidobacteria bacterium]|nr:patatin-like phospholipase family protein [Acidobacteriota bacterium]